MSVRSERSTRRPIEQFKRLVRTAQTFAPGLQDLRYKTQRAALFLMRRPVDPDLALLSRLRLPPGGLLLDVGANRGLTMQAFEMLLPERPIQAFEPNPILAEGLRRRWAKVPAVKVHTCALGHTSDTLTLYVPTYRGYVFDGLASLDADEAMGWLNADRILGFDPAHLGCRRYEVPVEPLDRFALAPTFIKIDVQGAEFAMLQGALETLKQHRPVLLIESPSASKEGALLADIGYVPCVLRHGRLQSNRVDGKNVFFLPRTADGLIAELCAS